MQRRFRRKTSWLAVCLLGALWIAGCGPVALTEDLPAIQEAGASQVSTGAQRSQSDPAEAFETMMTVLTHPRCINCHPSDNQPRQRDDQIPHILNVTRGEDNHGGPVQSCETCHHEENNLYSLVPGAPHWGLAPKSMGWLGLSHAEIAQALIDPDKNGGRSFDALVKHVNEDALVLWGWDPGPGRTPIPVPHDEFVQALETWLDAGAPIPGE